MGVTLLLKFKTSWLCPCWVWLDVWACSARWSWTGGGPRCCSRSTSPRGSSSSSPGYLSLCLLRLFQVRRLFFIVKQRRKVCSLGWCSMFNTQMLFITAIMQDLWIRQPNKYKKVSGSLGHIDINTACTISGQTNIKYSAEIIMYLGSPFS